MEKNIQTFILQADSKSLATIGFDGINVVPVSTIRYIDGKVWLFNYFMNRTIANIKENPQVALVCWTQMRGYQLKGHAQYLCSGTEFQKACDIVKELHPDRVLHGLITIKVERIFSVNPEEDSMKNLGS